MRLSYVCHPALDLGAWSERCRLAEAAGLDAVYVGDHLRQASSPMLALGAATVATRSIALGTYVTNTVTTAPELLARDVTTLLRAGRTVRLTLGTGSIPAEADLVHRSPLDRLPEELLGDVLARMRAVCTDPRTLTLAVASNRRALWSWAARHADGLALSVPRGAGPDGNRSLLRAIDEFRADRPAGFRLSFLVSLLAVTRCSAAPAYSRLGTSLGVDPDVLVSSPFYLLGGVTEIADKIGELADRYGDVELVAGDRVADLETLAALGTVLRGAPKDLARR